ncbi:alpha/beta hydrolase family protein [Paractinoplanes atraurantiacus]|uniref:Platelet-activating factor acetylhydrolase, isoform II n=1 Tax=Paractinoplanes atraurantiacus TaxID=1036182 RepID=A0A285JV96_9ACTN|nr:acetylhydrolase [Actinoplanes atraurantiacus]SNY63963.1 Platelet-activating factor acetylhydrolase, isoform II [Actinoplanes atraurantiacus]
MSISRRNLLVSALSATAVVTAGGTVPAMAAPPRLTLPPPTGPCPVGTVALRLLDKSRPDPFTGAAGHRELMVAVWYPARDAGGRPRAPWMDPAVLRRYLSDAGYAPDVIRGPLAAGRVGAPVRRAGRLPVVLFSHGAGDHRGGNTMMVQELASHGYLVVTIDHLGDAYSRLPDGRVVVPTEESLAPEDFAHDARFVLDRVEDLAAGRNPDADRRPLPDGLAGAPDLRRAGMFGWSKGGTATARVMLADRRVRAGVAVDGPMLPLMSGTIDRPFMMMTAEFTRAAEPAVARFFTEQLAGERLNVQAAGAVHSSYNDLQVLVPQLAEVVGMSDDELRGWIGTLDPARAVRIDQAYPLAFFDQHLRGRHRPLLDGPSRAFPEVEYLP